MKLERTREKHELAPYVISVLRDEESLAALLLELPGALTLLCAVAVSEHRELDADFALSISSAQPELERAYSVHANQLSRILAQVLCLSRYSKTRFELRLTLLSASGRATPLPHMLNALALTLMLARVEMRYFPVGAAVFVDADGALVPDAAAADGLTHAFLAKKLSSDDEVLGFAIAGGHLHGARLDALLSHLTASANAIGRRLLEFAHALATN